MDFYYELAPAGRIERDLRARRIDAAVADTVTCADRSGNRVLTVFAPPWVTPSQYSSYTERIESLPGADLAVDWQIGDWPKRGATSWRQEFVSGCEVTGSDRVADVTISCGYADFAGFLLGLVALEEMTASRVEAGGIAGVSCLSGLAQHHDALRLSAVPAEMRLLVHAGIVQICG